MTFKWAGNHEDFGVSAYNNLPFGWLAKALPWVTIPKYRVKIRVKLTAATLANYVGRCVWFNDAQRTQGANAKAWIQRLALVPGKGGGSENYLDVELLYLLDTP